jgi:hypothetical protein
MKIGEWIHKVYVNSELTYETEYNGLAHAHLAMFVDCNAVGGGYYIELVHEYKGDNFDPVLHSPVVERFGELPPCPNEGKCSWRKSIKEAFYTTPRKTALRTEVIAPQDRCGYMLLPNCKGGYFWDYAPCFGPSL